MTPEPAEDRVSVESYPAVLHAAPLFENERWEVELDREAYVEAVIHGWQPDIYDIDVVLEDIELRITGGGPVTTPMSRPRRPIGITQGPVDIEIIFLTNRLDSIDVELRVSDFAEENRVHPDIETLDVTETPAVLDRFDVGEGHDEAVERAIRPMVDTTVTLTVEEGSAIVRYSEFGLEFIGPPPYGGRMDAGDTVEISTKVDSPVLAGQAVFRLDGGPATVVIEAEDL